MSRIEELQEANRHADVEFLHEMGITLDEPEEQRRVPIIAAAFYCSVFSACFYAALWLVCSL